MLPHICSVAAVPKTYPAEEILKEQQFFFPVTLNTKHNEIIPFIVLNQRLALCSFQEK